MHLQEVNIEKIHSENSSELSDNFYRNCFFCDKLVKITSLNCNSCQKISGSKFYCPFCLRNNHHHRSSQNILSFSFRAIIGYYYYRLYNVRPHKIYLSQIENFIQKHENFGLQNPVFSYDPSLFIWYVNFNLIGQGPRKAPYNEIKETILVMLDSFELRKKLGDHARSGLYHRLEKAFDLFYEKRKRPKDKKILIPTLVNLVAYEKDDFFEKTREFTRDLLILK